MTQAQQEAVHDRYRKSFVGRSRASRDLALLDTIITESEALLATASDAERATLTERITLYRTERKEIGDIQAGGPAAIAAWRRVEWSEAAFSIYRRHFSGQARPTRDHGLVKQLAEEEAANIAAMPANLDDRLKSRKTQMEANLKLYLGEVKAIPEARDLMAPTEQARVLATCANNEFDSWRRHFEGKARHTRRPALLRRLLSSLGAIHDRMVAIRDMGVRTESHLGNITKVSDRLVHFRAELEKIEAARVNSATPDMVRSLGDEANKIFTAYRSEFSGKPRNAADAKRLSQLCDELQEIGRTMWLLQNERPTDGNDKNLGVVLDHIKMMEREHQVITEGRAKAT